MEEPAETGSAHSAQSESAPPASIASAGVVNLAASYLGLPLGVAVSVLTARLLGPYDKGLYSLFTNTVSFLSLVGAPFAPALATAIAGMRIRRPPAFSATFSFALITSALLTGITWALCLNPAIRQVLLGGLPLPYLLSLFLLLAVNLTWSLCLAVLNGIQEFGRNATLSAGVSLIANAALCVALGLSTAFHQALTVRSMVIIFLVISLTVTGAGLLLSTRVPSGSGPRPQVSGIARSALPLVAPIAARLVVQWVNVRADIYVLDVFSGAGVVGVYTVAVGTASQVLSVASAVAWPLLARFAHHGASAQNSEMACTSFRVLSILSFAGGVGLCLAAQLLIPIVYGARFASAAPLVAVLIPGFIVLAPMQVFDSYLTSVRRPARALTAEGTSLVVAVACNLLLIPRFGAAGAALSSTISYLVLFGTMTLLFRRLTGPSWSDLFLWRASDVRLILLVSVRLLDRLRTSWVPLITR